MAFVSIVLRSADSNAAICVVERDVTNAALRAFACSVVMPAIWLLVMAAAWLLPSALT